MCVEVPQVFELGRLAIEVRVLLDNFNGLVSLSGEGLVDSRLTIFIQLIPQLEQHSVEPM